jgi:hypothetical protein
MGQPVIDDAVLPQCLQRSIQSHGPLSVGTPIWHKVRISCTKVLDAAVCRYNMPEWYIFSALACGGA